MANVRLLKKNEINKRGYCNASKLLHCFWFRMEQRVCTEYPRGLAEWRFQVCQATGMCPVAPDAHFSSSQGPAKEGDVHSTQEQSSCEVG